MKQLRLIMGWMLFLVVGMLVGCGNKTDTTISTTPPIRVGVLRLASSAPIFIGIEKGFFAAEGLQIDPVWFDAAQPVAVATATGAVDVGATGLTAGLYNLAAGGQVPLIVADKGKETPTHSSSYLMVNQEAYQQGIRTVADLVGTKIGNTQAGSTYQYMIGNLLEQEGLRFDQVTYANLGKVNAIVAALQSHQITAAILNEPNASLVHHADYAVPIVAIGDKLPYQTSAIFYSPAFAKNDDLAFRFMRAYLAACRYYHEAVFAIRSDVSNEPIPATGNYLEIVRIVSQYTHIPEDEVGKSLPYIAPDAALDQEDIAKQISWYYEHGFMKTVLDPQRIIEDSFRQRALASLEHS